MCPNYEPEGQGRGSTFRICHAHLKKAILLHGSLVAGVYFFRNCTMVRFEKKLEDFQSFKLLSLILAVFWYIMAGLN